MVVLKIVSQTVIVTVVVLVQLDEIHCGKYDKYREGREHKGLLCYLHLWRTRSSAKLPSPSTSIKSEDSIPQTTRETYTQVRNLLISTGNYDKCSNFNFGPPTGDKDCQSALEKFKTIPRNLRGMCADAIQAKCHEWWPPEGNDKHCSFLVKTEAKPNGEWIRVKTCGEKMKENPTLEAELEIPEPKKYQEVRKLLIKTGDTDACPSETGLQECKAAYEQFRKIPRQFRGTCADATQAKCHQWRLAEMAENKCSFFVKTQFKPKEGQWWPVKACGEGMVENPDLPKSRTPRPGQASFGQSSSGATAATPGKRKFQASESDAGQKSSKRGSFNFG